VESSSASAYVRWLAAVRDLTGDAVSLAAWQDRRFEHANQVGALLTNAASAGDAVVGHVLYGVYLHGIGLAYVGQTSNAQRRLKDLPVGESHHLATTLPPELWDRVVVVQWPELTAHVPASEQAALTELGTDICGLALEYRVQLSRRPPLNGRRRTGAGVWVPRRPDESRSRGAVHADRFAAMHECVAEVWNQLEAVAAPNGGAKVSFVPGGRAVFPSLMLG